MTPILSIRAEDEYHPDSEDLQYKGLQPFHSYSQKKGIVLVKRSQSIFLKNRINF